MIWGVRLALVALGLSAALGNAQATALPAYWGGALVNAVGVNTHFVDPRASYARLSDLMTFRLQAAHLRHLRDGAIDEHGGFSPCDQAALFRRFGRMGIRTDFIVRAGMSDDFVRSFPTHVAPGFESYELLNEANQGIPNNAWVAPLRAEVERFHRQTQGYPFTIVGPSLVQLDGSNNGVNAYAELGDVSALIDEGNVHDYVGDHSPGTQGWGGSGLVPCNNTRYASLRFAMCEAAAASGNKPLVSTESGWGTDMRLSQGVTEAVQARYILRDVLLHFAAGFTRTYLYELMDTGSDQFRAFGLLHADGSPKPAYRMLAALLSEMDGDIPKRQPDSLDIDIEGATPDLDTMLLQLGPDTFALVLWVEAAAADAVPRPVTLRLPFGVRADRLCQFDAAGRCHWQTNSAVEPVTVTDTPVLLEMRR